jgi:hypothetical protein
MRVADFMGCAGDWCGRSCHGGPTADQAWASLPKRFAIAKAGPRVIHLPRRGDVVDVLTDKPHAQDTERIEWTAPAGPDTRVFRMK